MFSFQGKAQQVTLYANTIDCTTYGVCDGEFTVWVEGATAPFLFTFDVIGPGGPYSQTVTDTIFTFTGLCPGDYLADMTWDTTNLTIPGISYPDSCFNCTGSGSGGGGGGSAGGTVAQPCQNPIMSPLPDVLYCPGAWPTTNEVTVFPPPNVTVEWSYTIGNPPVTVTGTGNIPPITIPPGAAGQVVVDVNAVQDIGNGTFCFQPLSYNVVIGEYNYGFEPDLTICEGESVWINCGGWLSDQAGGSPTNPVSPFITTEYICGYPVTEFSCGGASYQTVIVIPSPTVDAGSDIVICEAEMVTLNGSGTGTLTWSNGVANGSSFSQAVGTQEYVLTSTNANGCEKTDTVEVTVVPNPIMDPVQDVYVCPGDWVGIDFFTVTPTGGLPITYDWSGPDNWLIGLNQTGSGGIYFQAQNWMGYSVQSTITVTPTLNGVCVGTPVTFIIGIAYVPTVDAGPDITVCAGELVTINGMMDGNSVTNGWYPYFWTPSVNDGIPFAPTTTQTYTLYYDDWTCFTSDQMTVTVLPNPPVDAGPDITICEGESVTLTANGSGTITWNNSVLDGDPFFPTIGSQEYIVESMQPNACSNSDTVVVTVLPPPIVDAGADQSICEGEVVSLDGTADPGAMWTGAGSYPNPSYPTLMSGGYLFTLTYTSPNGCSASDDMFVEVNVPASVSAGPDLTVCEGDSVTLIGTVYQANATSWSGSVSVTDGVPFLPPLGTSYYTFNGLDLIGNCSTSDDMTITVLPGITVNAGQNLTLCEGDSILLNATGADTYSWDVGLQNGDYYTPTGTEIIGVVGTAINGCSAEDSLIVMVNSLPVISAGPDQVICFGDSVVLSGSGGVSYVWDNSVIDNQFFTPTVGTLTYTVNGTDANGCLNTDQVDVTVNALPIVDAGLDQSVCDGVSVTLAGSGATNYNWDNNISNNSVFVPQSTLTYTVTGTDGNGCEATDQVTVIVLPNPIVDAGIDLTICAGDSILLNANGANTYIWDVGLQNGDYFTPSGSVVIGVVGTDVNGCFSQDDLAIVVNLLPAVDAGANQILCEGAPIVLLATGSGSLSWDNNVMNGIEFDQAVGSQVYTVQVTDLNGCQNWDSVTVVIEANPSVSFVGDNLEGCSPLTVTFTNTTGGNLTDCLWTFGNGEVEGGCNSVTTTFDSTGYFDVTLTTYSVNGCTNSETYTNYIYVEEDPIASFNFSPFDITTLHPEVQFSNTSIGADSYVWDFGDGSASSIEENPIHLFPDENGGGYTIELIAYSPLLCVDTAYATISVKEELIYYIPNTFTPDGNMYNQIFKPVFTSGFDPYDYQLLIFDRWGENIFKSSDPEIGWDGYCSYQYCQDGTYSWRIEFKILDGDERKVIHGHVNMIR
jgi:gliding motility-associated-like protein